MATSAPMYATGTRQAAAAGPASYSVTWFATLMRVPVAESSYRAIEK